MDAPPILTPERIDAMLSIMAEVCLESVVGAGQRQKTADDFESFERCGRSLQQACRNLRQTIAMKQRFDREQARKAEDARKADAEVRQDAARVREVAVARRRAQVLRHFNRVLWDEYEGKDAEELFDELEPRLRDLAFDDDFLETPVETLIQRLADEIGLNDDPADDPPEPPPETPPIPAGSAETSATSTKIQVPTKPLETARPRAGGDPSRPSAGAFEPPHGSPPARGRAGDVGDPRPGDRFIHETPSDAVSAMESDSPADDAPPQIVEAPPPQPPDPPPKPYVPPWEQLRPGERMPGGSGW